MLPDRIDDYRMAGAEEAETVWVVEPYRIDAVLETTPADRRDRLRGLRDLGYLRCQRGRLTGKVRDGCRPVRAYLFTVPLDRLPKAPAKQSRQRVTTW
jgi:hypothetical protein